MRQKNHQQATKKRSSGWWIRPSTNKQNTNNNLIEFGFYPKNTSTNENRFRREKKRTNQVEEICEKRSSKSNRQSTWVSMQLSITTEIQLKSIQKRAIVTVLPSNRSNLCPLRFAKFSYFLQYFEQFFRFSFWFQLRDNHLSSTLEIHFQRIIESKICENLL